MPSKVRGKRRLRSGLPRVFSDHRSPAAVAFRREYRAVEARFPGLPATAALWVREAALLACQLAALARDGQLARERGLVQKPGTLARQAARLRAQLLQVEGHLTTLRPPPPPPPTVEERIAAARRLSQPGGGR